MRVDEGPGGLEIEAAAYRLTWPSASPYARLESGGEPWADLLLDASLHTRSGLDETVARAPARVRSDANGWSATVALESTIWRRKELRVEGDETSLRISVAVAGEGHLVDVHLLGAWSSALPGRGTGFRRSGAGFRTLFSPEPSDPARLARPASEPATLDVVGGSGPGRGHWLFTPPPYCFALSRSAWPATSGDAAIPRGPWLALGVTGPMDALGFTAVHYEPAERSFSLRLEYEGHTRVEGRFRTPALVLIPGAADPYAAIGRWADDARERGLAPELPRRGDPVLDERRTWWHQPIFCGWGAQAALARRHGGSAPDYATQDRYDGFLGALAAQDLQPGTIVIDDRWQAAYGTGAPDPSRWPDLGGWIARRHEAGQRVLLWWKAWDPEGVPPELCVRNARGVPVAVDPSNPAYEAFLRAAIRPLLDPAQLGADGLKVDFTALTPSGPGLATSGPEWGTSLLHRLLWILHDEAHLARPDALVITHAPHPAFAGVSDMLRLNDMLRLGEPQDDTSAVVSQMRHRAGVAAAACPGTPIDTDDWCAPDLGTWREYLDAKLELGVPALYYATELDRTGERLEPADYARLREVWAAARARTSRHDPALAGTGG